MGVAQIADSKLVGTVPLFTIHKKLPNVGSYDSDINSTLLNLWKKLVNILQRINL